MTTSAALPDPSATEPNGLMFAPLAIIRAPQLGPPDDQELALINKLAPTPLNRDDVYVVPGVASTNAPDTYYTHMDEKTSMQNFVKDLKGGAAFLDSHNSYRLPVGASYFGEIRDVEGGKAEGVDATREVAARFYLLRNHNVPGSGNTDDYIKGIQGGTIRRLSIGFGGPKMRIVCDEDGLDLWDWDSDHYPGEVLADGRTVLYTVYDAQLYETSMVYKNATPGALIQRCQELISDRRIPASAIQALEQRMGARFARPEFRAFIGGTTGKREDTMPVTITQVLAEMNTRAGAALSAANKTKISDLATRASDAGTSAQSVADELLAMVADSSGDNANAATSEQRAVLAVLGTEYATADTVRALVRDAEAGKAHRKTIIEETIRARSAAQNGMDAEATAKFRRVLESQDFDDLIGLCEAWGGKRSGVLQSGRVVPVAELREVKNGAGDQGGNEREGGELYEMRETGD